MPNSPQETMNAMMKNLKEKTGHDFNHWLDILNNSGQDKHMKKINFLKKEHGLTHGYANFIVMKSNELSEPVKSDDDLLNDLFKNQKMVLRPIYDQLVQYVNSLGSDVEVAPRKTYVTIRRNKQFAIFKPSTKERLDVGLILKGHEETPRLSIGKQFSGMMSHCVAIHSDNDIYPELKNWIKTAYENA